MAHVPVMVGLRLTGWLPFPAHVPARPGLRWRFTALPLRSQVAGDLIPVQYIDLAVHDYAPHGATLLALRSEDTPVEVLRRIPGFIECLEVANG